MINNTLILLFEIWKSKENEAPEKLPFIVGRALINSSGSPSP